MQDFELVLFRGVCIDEYPDSIFVNYTLTYYMSIPSLADSQEYTTSAMQCNKA
jgi:hypothetical protein